MSLKERMREIREAQGAEKKAEETRRATEEAKEKQRAESLKKIKEASYEAGLPEALKVQAELFEELREVGIISLLEEIVEREILLISVDATITDNSPEELEKPQEGLIPKKLKKRQGKLVHDMESAARRGSGKWTEWIPLPDAGKNGWPKHVLKIEIERVDKSAPQPNMTPDFLPPVNNVLIKYDRHKKRLIISGKESVTFKGYVSRTLLPQYEDVIARAFLNPKVDDRKKVSQIIGRQP